MSAAEASNTPIDDLRTSVDHVSPSTSPNLGPTITTNDIISPIPGGAQAENPWEEQADAAHQPIHRLTTPDLAVLEAELATGNAKAPLPTPPRTPAPASSSGAGDRARVSGEILREFDPLVDVEEKQALAVWADAEGHPPPPQQVPPAVPFKADDGRPRSSSRPGTPSLNFPSFATLARTVSASVSTVSGTVAGLAARPRSMEVNPSILSPTTISSFVAQQGEWGRSGSVSGSRPSSRNETRERSRSEGGSPRPGKELEKDSPPPFDFQKFLDQMKTKGAEPVAKYLRSFLSNFAKRTLTVNDQIRVINEFLAFIATRMRESDVWRTASEAEFDNAMEAMEKLVMNRLYDFTFTPQLAESEPPRPLTTDDLERDRVLAQRIAIFSWIEEQHLDVPEGPESRGFLMFAQQELLKINHYKAPRDKLICILNCCKVIFGLIRQLHKEENADSFVPILIYVVLKANPPHLISNVEYINRFRSPQKLQSEAGYYLSSLMGAVSFIETMDHSSLSNITSDEFEHHVEQAIHTLPESPPPEKAPVPSTPPRSTTPSAPRNATFTPSPLGNSSNHAGEESAQPLALAGAPPNAISSVALADDARRFLQRTGDTLSKPLNALGRIFSEAIDGVPGPSNEEGGRSSKLTYLPGPFMPYEMGRERERERLYQTPTAEGGQVQPAPFQAPYKPRVRPIPVATIPTPGSGYSTPEGTPSRSAPMTNRELAKGPSTALAPHLPPHLQPPGGDRGALGASVSRTPTPALDIAGIQAEIDRATERTANANRGTLAQIFPMVDPEVIEWVLEAEEGDLGRSIEKLLEMSAGD